MRMSAAIMFNLQYFVLLHLHSRVEHCSTIYSIVQISNILLLKDFILIILFLSIKIIFFRYILSYKNYIDRNKQSVFECGFSIKINRRIPISLRFFLIALIFLIFDIELVLLFPYLTLIITSKFIYNIF